MNCKETNEILFLAGTGELEAGAERLLVMDVFEHAFLNDYGLETDKYISSFWNAVCWTEVERRFDASEKRR